MAVSEIRIPRDERRDAKARELAPLVGTWPKHTLRQDWGSFPAGTVFRRATGSNGEKYLVNAVACQCPDYQQRDNICKHVRAYVLWETRQQAYQSYKRVHALCELDGCLEDRARWSDFCEAHSLSAVFG